MIVVTFIAQMFQLAIESTIDGGLNSETTFSFADIKAGLFDTRAPQDSLQVCKQIAYIASWDIN